LPRHFFWKAGVADGEDFVDDEDFRLEVGGDGEGEADVHAAGVALDGGVEEFSTSAKATISSNLRVISARVMPRMAPLRKMFSRPVSSGWKPVPTSRRLATRPRISMRPLVGSVMRERILSRVLCRRRCGR
jgi:hypothetical protein